MNFNMNSVVKAGGLAAAVGLIAALLANIPVLDVVVVPILCCGWFLIPLSGGAAYGYFTPGKETLGESALGGALAGGFGGLVFGIIAGITGVATNVSASIGEQGASVLLITCFTVFVGLLLGAIGGALWPLFQANRGR